MHFWECLKSSLVGVVAGLFLGFVSGWAVMSSVGMLLGPNGPGPALAMGLLVSATAILTGSIPALTYGAFAYACLLYWKRATFLTSLVVGVVPGILLFLADKLSLEWVLPYGTHEYWLLYGALVSVAAHVVVRYGRV